MTRHDLIAADFRHHCHGACCASCRQPASYADRLPQYRLPSRPTTKPDLCLAFSTRSAGSSSPKQPVARLSSEQSRQRALATFPIAPEQPAPSFNPASMRSPPTTQRVARLGPRPHRTLKIPRNNQKLYIDERYRQLGLSAPRRPTDSASLNRSGLTFQRTIRSPRVREPGDGGSGPCLTALGLFIDPFCRQAAAAAAWPSSRVGCAQRDPSRRAPRRHCPRWARPRGDFGQHQHPPLWRWRSRREHRHTSLARAR